MTSAIRNLLDELSWEGRSTSYRGGGAGRENVLTTEVWQALDQLPRTAFLGAVLEQAHHVSLLGSDLGPAWERAGRHAAVESARRLECEVLCGDRSARMGGVRVQPDVLLESESALVLVEAKRAKAGAFQPEQLARNLLVLDALRGERAGTLLLVLGSPPPIKVKGMGELGIGAAVSAGLSSIRQRDECVPELSALEVHLAWITWAEIAANVNTAAEHFVNVDPDVVQMVERVAGGLTEAVRFHS